METKSKSTSKTTFFGLSILIVALSVSAGYYAFNQYKLNEQLQAELDEMELMVEYSEMESKMARETFVEIERNLAAIRESEGFVSANLNLEGYDPDLAEDRIQAEIEAIETLLGQNRELIASLKSDVGSKDGRIADYEKSVAVLQNRINGYKTRIDEVTAISDELHLDLIAAKEAHGMLTEELVEKEELMEAQIDQLIEQDKALRTGYYTVGTFKELKEENVVVKKGGLFGLASAKTLKEDFDREQFIKIDIYDNTTIPVFSPKAELISNHDTDSYEWIDEGKEVRWIQILDPHTFWENSKYAVVVTKGGSSGETTAYVNK